jgi:hypothetical protein
MENPLGPNLCYQKQSCRMSDLSTLVEETEQAAEENKKEKERRKENTEGKKERKNAE